MWAEGGDGYKSLLKDEEASTPGGGMLQEYSEEFVRLRALAASKLQDLRDGGVRGSWGDEFAAAERVLCEIESNRRQVQVQLRLELSGASGAKQTWEGRLQEWTRELSGLRGELDAIKTQHGRHSLQLGGDAGAGGSWAERTGVQTSTDLLDKSSRKLEEAREKALESENIGQGILSDLAMQRETILHIRDNVRSVDSELSSAKRALDRMHRLASQNRIITWIVFSIVTIGLFVWVLSVLDLPMKQTILLASAMVFTMTTVCLGRHHYHARKRLAEGRV